MNIASNVMSIVILPTQRQPLWSLQRYMQYFLNLPEF